MSSSDNSSRRPVPEQVPVLTQIVPPADVPPALGVALDARMAEKQALLDLSQDLIQKLKPEVDRLASELVQRTLQEIWEKRSEKYQNSNH